VANEKKPFFSVGEDADTTNINSVSPKPLDKIAENVDTNNNDNNINDPATRSVSGSGSGEHETHQLFCEMDELQENYEWKEAARWLKFEEDVDDGGRWSKPHVATLSLHSLLELRSCLMNGSILLDFSGDELTSIIGKLIFN
jgi:hypothetical protein